MSKRSRTKLRKRNVGLKKKPILDWQERRRQISDALSKKDVSELRILATTGPGLVDDGLRRLCWPLLLHFDHYKDKNKPQEVHNDEHQVLLDVERSCVYFPQGLNHVQKKKKQSELNDVIVGILRRHPKLSYYQGFHDICLCLLILLGKNDAIKAGENIAMFLLRYPFTSIRLFYPILRQLNLLNTLICLEDSEIANFLEESNTLPYFCLSWVITWCSHDIHDYSKVIRLFDFFIASDPLITIYLAARVIISRRKELLTLESDSATVHTFLSKFPQHINIDGLISETIQLYHKHPPHKLQKESNEELDEKSCVNLYEKHWLELKADYSVVDKILSNPPSVKKPVNNSKKSNSNKKQPIIFAVAVTVIAIIITSNWLWRSTLTDTLKFING
ncbi:11548_t:CDS:2 [Funneliformis geosporum]|uniref:13038_t:CDS:1 n=1 Tax=Funneliformis geosporum TaxID=1117311 RepID=A0A9W4SU81_9GLOM|nr:13038_t:CDS:2 [Funneliformis geosporum]CAI2183451.1 11548_t:CDS:2 [Funneliformis geosporum]